MPWSVISCRKVTDNQGSTGHVDAVCQMSQTQAFCEIYLRTCRIYFGYNRLNL